MKVWKYSNNATVYPRRFGHSKALPDLRDLLRDPVPENMPAVQAVNTSDTGLNVLLSIARIEVRKEVATANNGQHSGVCDCSAPISHDKA